MMQDNINEKLNDKFRLIKNGELRVRFAPSPTGFLHIGSARTALFNYLFAKKHQGKVILRIEDTDIERSKKEFELDIIENLKWLGINWDEGPVIVSPKGETREFPISNFQFPKNNNQKYIGNYGPYRQSERRETYRKYLEKLLEENKAYYCFCQEEEIEAKKQEQISRGLPPHYNGKCAKLPPEEIEKKLAEKKSAVIRFKVPAGKISFVDMIRGKIEFDTGLFGDTIIAKNLNSPLYNFAAAVDDFEMEITHVIRGEDHLSNTPKQILLQEALGFTRPVYAHLPLILGPDKSKLSKRHGAMAVSEYKKLGYLPEALINFLAFLGWNPGTEREIYQLSSLIKDFSVEKIQKSGAVFNIKRLDYLNGFYIRQKSLEKLAELCSPYFIEKGLLKPIIVSEQYPPAYGGINISQIFEIAETKEKIDFNYLKKIIALYQERLKKISEITDFTDFFFKDRLDYPKELLFWKEASEEKTKQVFDKLLEVLLKINKTDWNKQNIENILMLETEKSGDRGALLWPLRAALTGKKASAGPFEIAEILGKEKTLKRIKEARELLDNNQ
jgi:glutamyl-tRNA synthetase